MMVLRSNSIAMTFLCCCSFTFFFKETYSKVGMNGNSFKDLIHVIEKVSHEEEELNSKFCVCGEENTPLSARVIGGEDVEVEGKYPWMVALLAKESPTRYSFFCGAAVISERYVLTAAHCVLGSPERHATIRINVGIHRLPIISQSLKGVKYIIHPSYLTGRDHEHDLALIKLAQPLKFSDSVRPICLPTSDNFPEPNEVVIAGWGMTSNPELDIYFTVFDKLDRFLITSGTTRENLDILQTATLSVVPNSICREKYEGQINITDVMICAVGKGKGACYGDSGSSLISEYKGRWYSVGVVSGGKECASEAFPGIYNRVSHHVDWILRNTRDAPPCVPE